MTKRLWMGIAALVLVGALAAWLISRRNTQTTPPTSAKKTETSMPGMPGMPGMAMSTDGSVTVSADQIRQLGVTFGTVELRPMVSEARASGVVTLDEARSVQVVPKLGGFAERLYVNTTGQRVQKGEPLLELYSPEFVAAQQELLLAAKLDRDAGAGGLPGVPATATTLLSSAKRRLSLWDISDAQMEAILRAGQPRRTLTFYSPITGVVIDKKIVEGQSVMAGQELYSLANLSEVWIDIQLRETDASTVAVGTAADLEVAALPGRRLVGRVTYLYPTLDTATRAIRARVVVANNDASLKPGMYATVRLRTPRATALTVPASAVLRTGVRNVVFADMGNGRLQPMVVDIGRTSADYIEVLSGLEPGQRVVTSAQFLLDSESNLGEVMRSMIGQMGR